MADRISNQAFDLMTAASDKSRVDISESTRKATTIKENLEEEAQYFFKAFLKDVGVEPWSDERFALEKLWEEGGSPIVIQKTADELGKTKKWTGNKKYYLEGVEAGRPHMRTGRLGTSGREIETKDKLYINKGKQSEKWNKFKIKQFLAELAHSYDYGKRTQAARDSLEQERLRTYGLFGGDVYGRDIDDISYYPEKHGESRAWVPYVPGETDIKILPPEFRTHKVIQKNLMNVWDIYNKPTGE